MIRQIAPQFFTTDIPATLAYYKDKLGFECLGTWDDPPVYAIVARDHHAIHFRCAAPPAANPDKYAEAWSLPGDSATCRGRCESLSSKTATDGCWPSGRTYSALHLLHRQSWSRDFPCRGSDRFGKLTRRPEQKSSF
jgi:hypothetical protein